MNEPRTPPPAARYVVMVPASIAWTYQGAETSTAGRYPKWWLRLLAAAPEEGSTDTPSDTHPPVGEG